MDEPQFTKLERKLDLVLKMLAIDKLHGKKQIAQVAILTDFGLSTGEIASILAMKSSSVHSRYNGTADTMEKTFSEAETGGRE